jgi:hypothetical protein
VKRCGAQKKEERAKGIDEDVLRKREMHVEKCEGQVGTICLFIVLSTNTYKKYRKSENF